MKICPVLAAVLIWFPCNAQAQQEKLPSREEAFALVRGALASASLKNEESTPFHLVANVQMKYGSQKSEGNYEILWSAPDKYRVNLQTTTVAETEIALGDKLYVLRSTPALSLEMWATNRFLREPAGGNFSNLVVKSVSSQTVNERKLTCVDASPNNETSLNICLDPGTNELALVRMEYIPRKRNVAPISLLELSDFVTVGDMRYPRHLAESRDIVEIQAEVQKFETSSSFAEDVFQADQRATAWEWCASPTVDTGSTPKKQGKPTQNRLEVWEGIKDKFTAYSIVVGPDGKVKKAYEVYSNSSLPYASLALSWEYNVHKCSGRPVSYESVTWMAGPIPQH